MTHQKVYFSKSDPSSLRARKSICPTAPPSIQALHDGVPVDCIRPSLVRWMWLQRRTSRSRCDNFLFTFLSDRSDKSQVEFANQYGLPFFARAGGHSPWEGLSELKQGIAINMRKLNLIEILSGGQKVKFGGGVIALEAVHQLHAQGKRIGTFLLLCLRKRRKTLLPRAKAA